jgi:gamma-glutamyltranspeptidase/glutathione hydrolase
MVATDSPHASQIGADILKAGGNAVDAAVAVSFALAVVRPQSTGLGGGGFMIVRFADGRVVVQDARETAPAAATPDLFEKAAAKHPNGPAPSRYGHLAVAVPGLVAGRCQALSAYGTIPLSRALAPAIRLAKQGFPVDQHYVESVRTVLGVYQEHPTLKQSCSYVYRTHARGGKVPEPGDTLIQPELGRLLEGIAEGGPEFFYRGPVAKAIAQAMDQRDGVMTAKDLAEYRVLSREPIRSTYRTYELITMPPPSSGGVALVEALNVLEARHYHMALRYEVGLAAHYQVEALKHAFADRARWLGDTDFVDVPVDRLTSRVYAEGLAASINPNQTAELDRYGLRRDLDDGGTSHICVVDREGNVVVSTETINTEFGSLTAVDEWGLILNNEMDDFAAEPGKANSFGLVHSARNAIAPGKRPLSSMTPTIVLKDGEPYLMLGASGGPRIISSVLNVLLGVVDAGLTLKEAMLRPRPHHQWQPDQVFFNEEPPPGVSLGLVKRGHEIAEKRKTGIVQAILRTQNGWQGASDPRKGGRPAGY